MGCLTEQFADRGPLLRQQLIGITAPVGEVDPVTRLGGADNFGQPRKRLSEK